MAIELPRRTTITRRQRPVPARADAGAVPTVTPPSDPGLRIPEVGVGNQIAQAGAAITEFAEREIAADERKRLREEGLLREADDTSYFEQLSEHIRDLEASSDLSDDQIVEEAGKFAKSLQEQIIGSHRGSDESRAILEQRLERRRVSFADDLAVKSIAASETRQNQTIGRRLSAITADVQQDPDVFLDDPSEVFRRHEGRLEEEIAFLGLNPKLAAGMRQMGREEIARSMISPMIQRGDFERAKALLASESLAEVLSPAVRRDMATRIVDAEKGLNEARAKGEGFLQTARVILGPEASEKEIRQAAGNLAGISDSQNLEFFAVGNNVLALDKGTGAVVQRIEGQTPEEEAERTQKVEKAKLLAKMEVITNILRGSGAPDIETTDEDGQPVEPPSITSPFGPEEAASEDAQDAMRLFAASRRLALAGESTMANSFLGQARFIMENSPEVRQQRELEKPISPELAKELGVRVGTTMRDVMNVIPRSPEEEAESLSAARQRGRERLAAEEQIAFIDEARQAVGDILEEIDADPTVVGAAGSVRRAAQTATGVIGDLATVAGGIALSETDLAVDEISELFDVGNENLSTLGVIENSVGLILARLRTPEGRIPVEVIRRSIEDVKLTGLTSSKQVRSRLNFILEQLDRRAEAVSGRFGFEQQKGEAQPKRFRIEDGKLVPVE